MRLLQLPGDKTYAELCALMKQHQNPAPNLIAGRFKFNTRVRKQDKSIADYMAELRIMTEFCEYGGTLEDMLRDRLVCGINDQKLQQRLLGEGSKLNLKKALDISLGMESAIKHATAIMSHHQQQIKVESEINKIYAPNNRDPTQPFHRSNDRSSNSNSNECFRCGGRHNAATCQFKHQECFYNHTKGHTSRVCRKRAKSMKNSGGRVHHAGEIEDHADSDSDVYHIYKFGIKRVNPIFEQLLINGISVKMEVDTGASLTIMSEKRFREAYPSFTLEPCSAILRTFSGEELKPVGSATVNVDHRGKLHVLPLVITPGAGPTLLGRNWLQTIRLDWPHIFNVLQLDSSSTQITCRRV